MILLISGAIVGLLLVEGICRLGVEDGRRSPETLWGSPLMPKDPRDLRAAGRSEGRYRYLKVDPALGWTITPNVALEDEILYRSDEAGLRIASDGSSPAVDPSLPRIAAFGDSFTHCDEVPFEDCWTRLVEQELGTRVFNAGVPGYGTDQAYLRYLALRDELRPDVVVLGLMIADIKRNVNVFRTFLAGWTAWTKPRFIVEGGELVLVNQPAAGPAETPVLIAKGDPLLARDWWYDPAEWRQSWLSKSVAYRFARARLWRPLERQSYYDADSEPTIVTAKIVEAFARDVEAAGGRFYCLLMPSEPHLRHVQRVPWQPLVDRLVESRVTLIDPTLDLYRLKKSEDLFEPHGHYSQRGNAVIARSVLQAFQAEAEEKASTLAVPEPGAGFVGGLAVGAAMLFATIIRRATDRGR